MVVVVFHNDTIKLPLNNNIQEFLLYKPLEMHEINQYSNV